jgi:hypothetical protein
VFIGNPNCQQGIPAVILGLIAIAFLPDRPEMTRFLTEEERKIALARSNRDTSGDMGYHINKSKSSASSPGVLANIFPGHIVDAFKDWRVRIFGDKAFVASL